MKHIKLFEGFDANNNPTSITLEILPEFYNRMKESNGTVTDGSYGYPDPKNIQLFDESTDFKDDFNLCYVARLNSKSEYNYGGVISKWISYRRDILEISMYESIFDFDTNRKLMDYASGLPSTSPIYKGLWKNANRNNIEYNRGLMPQDTLSKVRREEWNFFNPTGYCKFEDGVEPGKTDHRGYFRIKEVK